MPDSRGRCVCVIVVLCVGVRGCDVDDIETQLADRLSVVITGIGRQRREDRDDFKEKKVHVWSIFVHPVLPSIFDQGPESPLLVLVSENGLHCLLTKVDEITSA